MTNFRRKPKHLVRAELLRQAVPKGGTEPLCIYCREPMTLDGDDPANIEHLRSGGGNGMTNLRVTHMSCNMVVGCLPVQIKRRLAKHMQRGVLPAWVRPGGQYGKWTPCPPKDSGTYHVFTTNKKLYRAVYDRDLLLAAYRTDLNHGSPEFRNSGWTKVWKSQHYPILYYAKQTVVMDLLNELVEIISE